MNTKSQKPIRIVLTMGIDETADVHDFAGELLHFLTSRPEVKRAEPTRIQQQVESLDGGLEWKDVDYRRERCGGS